MRMSNNTNGEWLTQEEGEALVMAAMRGSGGTVEETKLLAFLDHCIGIRISSIMISLVADGELDVDISNDPNDPLYHTTPAGTQHAREILNQHNTSSTFVQGAERNICVDFNGVLDTYKGWTGKATDYPPRDGVRAFLEQLSKWGYHVVVLTSVDPIEVQAWLTRYGLDRSVTTVTNVKPPAICYVDDRAVEFKGSFEQTLSQIENFKAYWEDDPDAKFG
jgi:hypothetical protein